jgi:hypothetical protein
VETQLIRRQLMIRCLSAAVVIALVVAGIVKAAHLAPATQAPSAVLLVVILVGGWWRFGLWRGLAPFDGTAPIRPPVRVPGPMGPSPLARQHAETNGDD